MPKSRPRPRMRPTVMLAFWVDERPLREEDRFETALPQCHLAWVHTHPDNSSLRPRDIARMRGFPARRRCRLGMPWYASLAQGNEARAHELKMPYAI